MLDLGANVDCDANNLVQFAVMGEVFARNVLGLAEPSIGLLNVGCRRLQGARRGAHGQRDPAREPAGPSSSTVSSRATNIGAGTVDVVVTDGFTGNIALKTDRGNGQDGRPFPQGIPQQFAVLEDRRAAGPQGPERPEEPPWTRAATTAPCSSGLNGICVKSHGSTDEFGFANAIGVAANLIKGEFNERIKEDLGRLISGDPNKEAVAS